MVLDNEFSGGISLKQTPQKTSAIDEELEQLLSVQNAKIKVIG